MDPRDALRLTFLKDAVLAAYQSRAALWQTVQGGAGAAMPLAALALTGQLAPASLWTVLELCIAVIGVCALALYVNRRQMERDMRALLDQIEKQEPGR